MNGHHDVTLMSLLMFRTRHGGNNSAEAVELMARLSVKMAAIVSTIQVRYQGRVAAIPNVCSNVPYPPNDLATR